MNGSNDSKHERKHYAACSPGFFHWLSDFLRGRKCSPGILWWLEDYIKGGCLGLFILIGVMIAAAIGWLDPLLGWISGLFG